MTIEALWNQIIISKFKSKINIEKEKIKDEIIKSNDKILSFDLSEIIFNINKNQILDKKFKDIKNDIKSHGFENAATMHSISDSAKIGGDIGWINENSLNKNIKKQ